jgi:hypothetical protein
VNRPALKSVALASFGAALVTIQFFRAPEESLAAFGIVATCWWFARLKLVHSTDRHPHRAKRARQIRRAVVNSGVISAAFWFIIALVKASRDMSTEQGEELISAWEAWPGLFLLNGLLVILGLTYAMVAACAILFAQPRSRRKRRISSKRVETGPSPVELE